MKFRCRSIGLIALALLAAGCGSPSLLITPVQNTSDLNEEEVQPAKGWTFAKVAIIPVDGMIANARSGGFLAPTENSLSLFEQEIEKAAKDDDVKAVVLRINSPGGTVSASDAIYETIKRFRAKTHKPVVAAGQEVMASGAYYVACGCDKIVAQPTSLVGSIGVIFENFDFTDGLAKIGVRSEAVKSGVYKDMGSPFKHATADERQVMQSMVDEYFGRFQGIVRSNRPVRDPDATDLGSPAAAGATSAPSQYTGVFSGRVWSGDQAMQLGLVDQVGLLSDAINLARDLANAHNASAVLYMRPYGYGGSIYATSQTPKPQASVLQLQLPQAISPLDPGFYYLWQPGL